MENTLFDRTFRDGDGNIVIAQPPNLPLLVWFAATLLRFLLTRSNIQAGLDALAFRNLDAGLDALAFGSLFTWAWLELFQGVNYFRRAIGLVVLLGVLALRLQWS